MKLSRLTAGITATILCLSATALPKQTELTDFFGVGADNATVPEDESSSAHSESSPLLLSVSSTETHSNGGDTTADLTGLEVRVSPDESNTRGNSVNPSRRRRRSTSPDHRFDTGRNTRRRITTTPDSEGTVDSANVLPMNVRKSPPELGTAPALVRVAPVPTTAPAPGVLQSMPTAELEAELARRATQQQANAAVAQGSSDFAAVARGSSDLNPYDSDSSNDSDSLPSSSGLGKGKTEECTRSKEEIALDAQIAQGLAAMDELEKPSAAASVRYISLSLV